jgi:hypothetical protein
LSRAPNRPASVERSAQIGAKFRYRQTFSSVEQPHCFMSQASIAFPRGLVAGSCFALLLAAPLFFAISLDSSAPSFTGRFRFGSSSYARPRPISSSAEFFARQVAVQVSVGFGAPTAAASRSENFFGVNDADSRTKPKKTLQLRVENRSDKELSIDVREAKSEFGDLSAGLQTIRLSPGQMTQTGVALKENAAVTKPSPVEVTLRLNGTEEKHELVLAPAAQP